MLKEYLQFNFGVNIIVSMDGNDYNKQTVKNQELISSHILLILTHEGAKN